MKRTACLGVLAGLMLGVTTLAVETGLVDSVKNGDRQAVRSLLTAHPGADTANAADADGTSALHWAVHRNDPEMADLLIRAGASVARRTATVYSR